MPIIVIPAIAARISEIESSLEPFDSFGLSTALEGLVGDASNLTAEERLGCVAEIVGWMFMPARGSDMRPWNSYFGPIFTGTTADGVEVYNPDARTIAAEVIEYWKERSEQTPHPAFKARYADLALEIGQIWNHEHPDESPINLPRELRQRAIDAHLSTVEDGLADSDHQAWTFLNRALDLAAFIHDADRVERAKRGAYAYCRLQQAAGESGCWWNLDNLMWDRKGLTLSDAERDELVAWLDEALAIHSDISDEKRFDPHQAKDAADRLMRWHNKLGQPDLGIAAIKKAGAAFEAIAAKTNALTAIAWLEDLSTRYRHAKLNDDVARVDAAIKARSGEAEQSMTRHEVEVEIPKEETDRWLDALTTDSLDLTLSRIAIHLMNSEEKMFRMVEESAASAPLMAHISISLTGINGFTRATVGSVKDDMPGRVINMAATMIGHTSPWLHMAFGHAKTRWQMDADNLFGWLTQSPLFPANVHGLLREGIDAWFAEDHVKAIHILVPQAEASLREWLSLMDESPMKFDRDAGGFEVLGMGNVLHRESFRTKVDPTLRLHLRALYTDPKGLNLRNRIAHGVAGSEILNRGTANWVVHSLLAIRASA